MFNKENVKSVQIDDLMIAMDAVDTLRHKTSLLETELTSDERKTALKVGLRQYYAEQGVDVTDEILDKAVEDMDKNRYVHVPLKQGFANSLAHMWVDRGRIGKKLAITGVALLATFFVANTGYDHLVVQPREMAAAELRLDIEQRLPAAIKEGHIKAVAAAKKYDDEAALSVADNIRDKALALLANEKIDEVRQEVVRLNEMAVNIEAKVLVSSLTEKASKLEADLSAKISDKAALRTLASSIRAVKEAASKGDLKGYELAVQKLNAQAYAIETPLTIRIVDRTGVKAGVWRSQNGGATKVHYIVVEALDPVGKVLPMNIKNVETGATELVNYWGIRVPEAVYNRVGKDKQSDGIVDDTDAGIKPAGTLEFDWSLETINNHMITRW